jgi:protein-tyrosine phosphatase family protein
MKTSLHDRLFEGEATPLGIDVTQLTKGLWIGSKPKTGRAVADSGFNLLVLCAEEYQPPTGAFPGVEVFHAPFDDNTEHGPSAQEKKIATRAATRVAHALREDANVLVTCYAGRNRSGIVCALALAKLGYSPVRAVNLIQGKRKDSLTNKWFVNLITQG